MPLFSFRVRLRVILFLDGLLLAFVLLQVPSRYRYRYVDKCQGVTLPFDMKSGMSEEEFLSNLKDGESELDRVMNNSQEPVPCRQYVFKAYAFNGRLYRAEFVFFMRRLMTVTIERDVAEELVPCENQSGLKILRSEDRESYSDSGIYSEYVRYLYWYS